MSINSLIAFPEVGGVYVIALAPASMVSFIVSSFGPPVAMIGNSGNSSLIFFTILGVSAPPETFIIVAPASILLAISSFSETFCNNFSSLI